MIIFKNNEPVVFIGQSDDLKIGFLSLKESNQSKIGFWLQVDGSHLHAIDAKVLGSLDNAILQEKKGKPSSLASIGNKSGLHVLEEDSAILIFEA